MSNDIKQNIDNIVGNLMEYSRELKQRNIDTGIIDNSVVRLDKISNSIESGIETETPTEDLKFEITKVLRERSLDGSSHIEAKCLKDGVDVYINVKNSEVEDKPFIKGKLIEEYKRLIHQKSQKGLHEGIVI